MLYQDFFFFYEVLLLDVLDSATFNNSFSSITLTSL